MIHKPLSIPVSHQTIQSKCTKQSSRALTLQPLLSDNFLSSLTPSIALEALTSSSCLMNNIIEAVTPNERAFGIRAVIASKKIHDLLDELSSWPWPENKGPAGFELVLKDRSPLSTQKIQGSDAISMSHLANSRFSQYVARLDEIYIVMEELRVDEIKRQVLDTHFSPKSRPSSSCSNVPLSKLLSSTSYNRIDDFTAIVTATILKALPKLNQLVGLMELWNSRLCVIERVPALMMEFKDVEVALESGWNAIQNLEVDIGNKDGNKGNTLSRESFDIIRHVLQQKVAVLGESIDYMLNVLEGSPDTLPESWLKKMEDLEENYGEWVVAGESKVRMNEWLISEGSHKLISSREGKIENSDYSKINSSLKSPGDNKDISRYSTDSVEITTAKTIPETHSQKSVKVLRTLNNSELPSSTINDNGHPENLHLAPNTETEFSDNIATGINFEPLRQHKKISANTRLKIERLEARMSVTTSQVEAFDTLKKSMLDRSELSLNQGSCGKKRLSVTNQLKNEYESSELFSRNVNVSQHPISQCTVAKEGKALFEEKDLCKTRREYQQNSTSAQDTEPEKPSLSIPSQTLDFNNLDDLMNQHSDLEPLNMNKADFLYTDKPDDNYLTSLTNSTEEANMLEVDQASGIKIGEKISGHSNSETMSPKTSYVQRSHSVKAGLMAGVDTKTDDAFTSKNSSLKSLNLDYSLPGTEYSTAHVTKTNECHYQSLPIPDVDGCVESVFVDNFNYKNDNSLDPSRTVSCSKKSQQSKNVSESKPALHHTSLVTSIDSFPMIDSVYYVRDASIELTEIMSNKPLSSEKVFFLGNNGTKYSLDLPLDGSTIYTNNDLSVAAIVSDIDISSLCEITTSDCVPNLLLGSQGTYNVVPPQEILSITYRCEPSSFVKDYFPTSSPNCLRIEPIKEPASVCTTEDVYKESQNTLDLQSQSENTASRSKISLDLEIETNSSQLSSAQIIRKSSGSIPMEEIQNSHSNLIDKPILSYSDESSHKPPTHCTNNTSSKYIKDATIPSSSVCTSFNSSTTMARTFLETKEQLSPDERLNQPKNFSFSVTPPKSPLITKKKPQIETFGPNPSQYLKPLVKPNLKDHGNFPMAELIPVDGTHTNKNDQFQQQISNLLESMPSIVCLSSEIGSKLLHSEKLRPIDNRQSSISNNRPASSLSNFNPQTRASTPPFTLAPELGKGTSRPRHQFNNSEIRVYHLSRSNGEAPIKLFVRLVGEHGERVMVRVGGGWADLGEYLREYASHHGRRNLTDTVKIQDTLSHKTSLGTLKTSSINRDSGRSSPLQGQLGITGERQKNSLNIQKTRKSLDLPGKCLATQSRLYNHRCPSTPLPIVKHANNNTPPSASSSNGTVISTSGSVASEKSSRMTWVEEEFNLGLAGPRSKKATISNHDLEWAESMTEKVRFASVEKERRIRERVERLERAEILERQRNRGLSLGGMEKVSGTKRLFKRDCSVA